MKMRLRLLFPAFAVMFILSMTGQAHEAGEAEETGGTHREIHAVHEAELVRAPVTMASSVDEYLKAYVTKVAAVMYTEEADKFCDNCGCHLVSSCDHEDTHNDLCNSQTCWCIGDPPYSGCYSRLEA